ncbi:MAG: HupE/UreJ family protein [Burkholderiales bacterium]|nr:HupE/UreJ family protein [Burkholderiales bacterium]
MIRVAFLLFASTPAWAHHGENMRAPATLLAGAIGGVAHPVLDFAHLGFLLALGVLALRSPRPVALLAWFGLFTLAGALAHLAGIEPLEGRWLALWVGATALLAGAAVATPAGEKPGAWAWCAVAVAGALHGSRYAESVEGAAPAVLAAYFATVLLVQAAIAAVARALAVRARHALAASAALFGGAAMAVAWMQA